MFRLKNDENMSNNAKMCKISAPHSIPLRQIGTPAKERRKSKEDTPYPGEDDQDKDCSFLGSEKSVALQLMKVSVCFNTKSILSCIVGGKIH